MSINGRLKRFFESAQKSDVFWIESAKLAFSVALEKRRKDSGMSYADLARKIDVTPAYISKVFRGDSNFTIETMVKLSLATGGRLDIDIADIDKSSLSWAADRVKLLVARPSSSSSGTGFTVAANHDRFHGVDRRREVTAA